VGQCRVSLRHQNIDPCAQTRRLTPARMAASRASYSLTRVSMMACTTFSSNWSWTELEAQRDAQRRAPSGVARVENNKALWNSKWEGRRGGALGVWYVLLLDGQHVSARASVVVAYLSIIVTHSRFVLAPRIVRLAHFRRVMCEEGVAVVAVIARHLCVAERNVRPAQNPLSATRRPGEKA
jgi:hypothetical protein